jgi:hypothetical protein
MSSSTSQSQRLLKRAKQLLQDEQQSHLAQEILIDIMRDGSDGSREEASRLFQEHFAPAA